MRYDSNNRSRALGFVIAMPVSFSILFAGCSQQGGTDAVYTSTATSTSYLPPTSSQNATNGALQNISTITTTGVDLSSDNDIINYPTAEYLGTGILYSIDDNPIRVRFVQEPGKDTVVTRTTEFSSSDKTINKNVNKLVGSTTYTRVSKVDLAKKKEENNLFRNETFIMFAGSSTTSNQNGTKALTYAEPFPFVIVPTEMRRYETLADNPAYYEIPVSGDGQSFTVAVNIELVSKSTDFVIIKHTNTIAADRDGKLYDLLPVPMEMTYTIDTKSKRVTSISSKTKYNNTHYRAARNIEINFKLCTYTANGQVESSTCG